MSHTHLSEGDNGIGECGVAPGGVLTVGLRTASYLRYIWRGTHRDTVSSHFVRRDVIPHVACPPVARTRTALHHLREGLHRRLLRAFEAALRQQGADHHLKGAASRHVVVLRRAGRHLTAAA